MNPITRKNNNNNNNNNNNFLFQAHKFTVADLKEEKEITRSVSKVVTRFRAFGQTHME